MTIRVCLLHWNAKERLERNAQLAKDGVEVLEELAPGSQFTRQLESQDPDAVIIDLTRLPSHGREMAVTMRARKGTRVIPIVFVEGVDAKVAQIKALLPDAEYTNWAEIIPVLQRVVSVGKREFKAVDSVFATYAGRPLGCKLGIKPGMRVCAVGAPRDFIQNQGGLPEGVEIGHDLHRESDLYLWFLVSIAEMDQKLDAICACARQAPTWLAWKKAVAGKPSDLTQQIVRQKAIALGLVDYKICSVNEVWSALLFKYRGK